ncbi:MAG: 30S ribosomal protein S9 [Solirubrobacterales bacterium]
MADDEKTPDETTEGPDATSAGPVEGSDTSSSPAAGESPDPTPAAEEAAAEPTAEAAAELEAPVEESAPEAEEPSEEAEEAPAAEPAAEEAPSEVPPAEVPAAEEKKKDVIPGADLEPIAVEPEARELSAEERARLEAEEEEKARREAALTATEEPDAEAASRAPAKMESGSRYLATGKRKRSIARVTLLPGDGKIEINKRSLEEFFPRPLHQTMARQPLTVSGYEGNVDVRVRVHGGGVSGQAGAVRHGIARALTEIDAELRGDLKRRGFLTRDARVKERRKAGFKKARKKPQFSKR